MKPVIINKNSKFVVITYWWGRGNLNKNTQRPCPGDNGDSKLTKSPIKYEKMINNMEKSCIRNRCNYMTVEYPEFAKPGGYQIAINYKAKFIKEALDACYPRGVLYIDGDMLIKKYPFIFDTDDVDYIARGWNMDVREDGDRDEYCFDPYVFETSGGTMFFGNTMSARNLLDIWINICKKYPGKADDRLISLVFNDKKLLYNTNIIQLPIEFLWLNLDYDDNISSRDYESKKIYITHPECLTTEEIAKNKGADSDRHPPNYNKLVSDKIKCGKEGDMFYEYIYFSKANMSRGFEKYLKWHHRHKLLNLVSRDKKFGKYNSVVRDNLKTRGIKLIKSKSVVLTEKDENIKNQHIVEYREKLIPTILKYLKKGVNVVYKPRSCPTRSLKSIVNMTQNNPELEFICRNTSKRNYKLLIKYNHPLFFSHTSKVLFNLLSMSRDFKEMEKIFNSGYMFISRIRIDFL